MPNTPAPSRHPAASRHRTARRLATLAGAALIATGHAMAQSAPPPRPPAAEASPTTPPPGSPQGRWISANGNVEVEIAHCGPAWCGTITRVLGTQSMSRPGEVMTPVDTRPALGMTILKDFMPDGDGTAGSTPSGWQGHIYNRENGKTYRCLMSLDAAGGLVLRPYVGLPLFGRTQVWRRADAAATARPAAHPFTPQGAQ
jgi:uncharacterized protein (DUF2147 family)